MKRIRVVLLFLALVSTFVVFSATASAHTTSGVTSNVVHPLTPIEVECNSPGYSPAVIVTPQGTHCYRQSGYTRLNIANADWFYAHGWSGYISYTSSANTGLTTTLFCVNDVDWIGGNTVVELYLAPSTVPWC